MRRTQVIDFVRILIVAALASTSSTYSPAQQSGPPLDSGSSAVLLSSILSHMEAARLANQQQFRAYTVTREYKLFDDEAKAQEAVNPNSEVIASVEFVPPNHKTFQIDKVEGSDRGKSIVKHILENESEMATKGSPVPLTLQYYDFQLLGETLWNGQPCWLIGLKPKHDDRTVIRGQAWVDKQTYLTHEVQGEMAKSPSWWIKKVQMTIRYGSAAGMWLPSSTYAVADVRFFGRHVLTSQALKLATADQVAQTFSSAAPRTPPIASKTITPKTRHITNHVPAVVGTGIYSPR